jgi:hypothetical protein
MKYVEEKNHELRYTLKDTSTGQVYLAVVFDVVRQTEDEQNKCGQGHDDASKDNLGKFEWEPEPSAGDVE